MLETVMPYSLLALALVAIWMLDFYGEQIEAEREAEWYGTGEHRTGHDSFSTARG
jgi:hypothetical protein